MFGVVGELGYRFDVQVVARSHVSLIYECGISLDKVDLDDSKIFDYWESEVSPEVCLRDLLVVPA